jgi:hypothetical protein
MEVNFFIAALLIWFLVSVTAAFGIASILSSGKQMLGETDELDGDENELERTQIPGIIASSV